MNTFLSEEAEHEEIKTNSADVKIKENNQEKLNNKKEINYDENELKQNKTNNGINQTTLVLEGEIQANNTKEKIENHPESIVNDNEDAIDQQRILQVNQLLITEDIEDSIKEEKNIGENKKEENNDKTDIIKEIEQSNNVETTPIKDSDTKKLIVIENAVQLSEASSEDLKGNEAEKISESFTEPNSELIQKTIEQVNQINEEVEIDKKEETVINKDIAHNISNLNSEKSQFEKEKNVLEENQDEKALLRNKKEEAEENKKEKEQQIIQENKAKVEVKLEIEEDDDNNQIEYNSDEDD